jgi:hypothetical protein
MCRMNNPHILLLLILFAALAASRAAAQNQTTVDLQYQRKAEMLCPLGGILLPAAALANDNAFSIGVLGGDPFQGSDLAGNPVNHLDQMATQRGTFKNKPIVVYRFDSVKDVRKCNVLFISATSATGSVERSALERLAAVLKQPPAWPMLVVADTPGAAEAGAVINFFVDTDPNGVSRVSFEINPAAAKRAGFDVNPQLLRLAARTVGDRPAQNE